MPRSFFTINDFSGGLVTANEPRDTLTCGVAPCVNKMMQ